MQRGYKALLEEARAEITAYTPEQAAGLIAQEGTILVDLRDPREIQRDGHIAGAKRCPRGMLEFWIDPESPYHKPYFATDSQFVFYCASGWRSALATKTAQDMGLPRVAHIEGGLSAWKSAGLPVASSDEPS